MCVWETNTSMIRPVCLGRNAFCNNDYSAAIDVMFTLPKVTGERDLLVTSGVFQISRALLLHRWSITCLLEAISLSSSALVVNVKRSWKSLCQSSKWTGKCIKSTETWCPVSVCILIRDPISHPLCGYVRSKGLTQFSLHQLIWPVLRLDLRPINSQLWPLDPSSLGRNRIPPPPKSLTHFLVL